MISILVAGCTDQQIAFCWQERMRAAEAREQLADEITAKGKQKSLQLDETLKAHEKQLAAMMDAREQQLVLKVTSKPSATYVPSGSPRFCCTKCQN